MHKKCDKRAASGFSSYSAPRAMKGAAVTEAELAHLLAWLSADPEEAARSYQTLHVQVVDFFLRQRCATASAEELADVTIDRVAAHLVRNEVVRQPQVLPFFLKFAQFVLLEHFRKQKIFVASELNEEIAAAPDVRITRDKEFASQCFDRCLHKLPDDHRQLFLRYYQLDEQWHDRAALAAECNISLNALRLRMMRLRETVSRCIEECQAERES